MSTPGPEIPPSLEALLRQLLGPQADAVLAELSEHGLGLTGPDGQPLDLAKLAADAGLPQDPASVQAMVAQVQRMLATGTGPVNRDLAHDIARQTSVSEGDPTPSDADRRQVASALQVAELWLDQATDLPPAGGQVLALSRAEWVERTLPRWQSLAEPIAASVAAALATTLAEQGRELAEAGEEAQAELGAAVAPMMRQLGSAVFGMQLGQAVGTLSREVLGTTDTGIPLVDGPGTALLPRNVAAFADGLDVPLDEVRLFLALREAAHARLFTHVSWLHGHLHGAVDAYARGVEIDLDAMTEAVRSIDPTDPQELQEALSGGVFAMGTTPAQKAALVRLETALALVEGWVDEVTAAAATPHLPHTAALRETMRRRRAAGGPAEDIMATLVGLELRPRRSRDAARLWALITEDSGIGGREHVWDHPDLLPTAEDLDDPAGYRTRQTAEGIGQADVDRALAEIFGEEPGEGAGDDEPKGDDDGRPRPV